MGSADAFSAVVCRVASVAHLTLLPLVTFDFKNIEIAAPEDFDTTIQWTSSVEAKIQEENKAKGEKKLTSGKLEHLRKEKVRKYFDLPKEYVEFSLDFVL